ncbi:MAG TPA: hypothetical protein VF146_20000 [Bryobacteraceae bacterium]
MSWYAHAGVTGVDNVRGETLTMGCGVAYVLIASCYAAVLETMINEFKLYHIDPTLKDAIMEADCGR